MARRNGTFHTSPCIGAFETVPYWSLLGGDPTNLIPHAPGQLKDLMCTVMQVSLYGFQVSIGHFALTRLWNTRPTW